MDTRVADELGLVVVGSLAGGEHGALAVDSRAGDPLVLKVFAPTDHVRLAEAMRVADRVRTRGVPVPDPYWSGTTNDRAYTLQRRCEGEIPHDLEASHATQLLEFWDAHRDAMPEGSDWPERAVRALLVGDVELWAEHAPIRAAGGAAMEVLQEIIAIGEAADAAVLRGTDAMHGDWHHRNLLVRGQTVSAVIDWESARAGDARYDLVLLHFWTDTYEGHGVSVEAADLVRRAVEARVAPDARRVLAALTCLHQLWFVCAYRPERVDETLDRTRRHLARCS